MLRDDEVCDVSAAMPQGSDARRAFDALTQPNQQRFVDRIMEAKTNETRVRRICDGTNLILAWWREKRRER